MAEQKKKPRYSTLQNISFLLKKMWAWDKRNLALAALRIPAAVLFPFLGTLLSSMVFRGIATGIGLRQMLLSICAYSAALLLCQAAGKYLEGRYRGASFYCSRLFMADVLRKSLYTDYENAESARGQQLNGKAEEYIWHHTQSRGLHTFLDAVMQLFISLGGLILFGSVLASLHPLIIALLVALTAVSSILIYHMNQYEYRRNAETDLSSMRTHMMYRQTSDFAAGKDIRLYGMKPWLMALFHKEFRFFMRVTKEIMLVKFRTDALDSLLSLVRDGVAYGVLIGQVLAGQIRVDQFILYFGMIAGLSQWLRQIANAWMQLNQNCLFCCDYREYLEMPDRVAAAATVPLPRRDAPCDIAFEHVSYRYPDAQEPTLRDIDLHIRAGEKIAVVGANGAGKTTLVKLLCGLYHPTGGSVRIDGTAALSFHRDEYFDLFAAVFQDIHFLPETIAENIALRDMTSIDQERLQRCLRRSGIWNDIEALPQGVHTPMIKEVHADAAEFSGGQLQKLVLARALYKNAPVLILDEPTAALDPIAESALYEQYNELTRGCTSFFISHRLASTRFCDRILFLSGGRVAEQGTHEELMALGGEYARMFQIQSHYYQETVVEEAV